MFSFGLGHRFFGAVALGCGIAFAAGETLFSNWAVTVAPGPDQGTLWVFSRGEVNQGVALLRLAVDGSGKIKVEKSDVEPVDNEFSAVQANIYADKQAERRRIPTESAGGLGVVLPMFGLDESDHFFFFFLFLSVKRVGVVYLCVLGVRVLA